MIAKIGSYFNFKKKPKLDFLTVVLLTYNRRDYVQSALSAIMRQTYKDFKILIIDNHSTDGTFEAIGPLIRDDERVTYTRLNKYSNAGNSFVTGVLAARSEYVLVTHDDDVLDDGYVEKIIKKCQEGVNIGLFAANARIINEHGVLVNDSLYHLCEDIYFDRYQYLEYYIRSKLWLPTPSLCFRKEHFLRYIGVDDYSYRSKGSFVRRRIDQFVYRPSLDNFYNIFINQYDGIFFFAEPQFSYRQHIGQESRAVNQSEPMLDLINEIKKAKFKIRNKNNFQNFEDRYKIQQMLFLGLNQKLSEYLESRSGTIHVCISSKLYLNKSRSLRLVCEDREDIYYGIYEALYLNKHSDRLAELSNKKIVLIGSMLCAYYMDQLLLNKGCNVVGVLDFTHARQGCYLNSKMIVAYEDFFYNHSADYLFIITSERSKDVSIESKVKTFYPGANCIFWQSIFEL